jgi:hypothetical protein
MAAMEQHLLFLDHQLFIRVAVAAAVLQQQPELEGLEAVVTEEVMPVVVKHQALVRLTEAVVVVVAVLI